MGTDKWLWERFIPGYRSDEAVIQYNKCIKDFLEVVNKNAGGWGFAASVAKATDYLLTCDAARNTNIESGCLPEDGYQYRRDTHELTLCTLELVNKMIEIQDHSEYPRLFVWPRKRALKKVSKLVRKLEENIDHVTYHSW